MSSTTSIIAPFVFAGIVFCYWAYKIFFGPSYKPGCVAKQARSDTSFDDPSLYKRTKPNKWMMPNGIEIFYFPPTKKTKPDVNKRVIPTIAIHGGPGIAPDTTWKLLADTIPEFYLYHARGCGKSTRPFQKWPGGKPNSIWPGIQILESTLGLQQQISDIERIRRRLAYEYDEEETSFPVHIVGHSFGGFIATLYASEFPQYVQSLTLLEPAGVMKLPNPKSDLFTLVRNGIQKHATPDKLHEFDDWLKEYMDFSTLPQQTETTLAKRQQEFATYYDLAAEVTADDSTLPSIEMIGGMTSWATFISMGIEHDYNTVCHEMLQDLKCPVTMVHGGQDLAPQYISEQYCNLFPSNNVTYKVIPNANHDLYNHPDIVKIVQETQQEN